jgi:hypothetical protein
MPGLETGMKIWSAWCRTVNAGKSRRRMIMAAKKVRANAVVSAIKNHDGTIKLTGIKAGPDGANVELTFNPGLASVITRAEAAAYGWIVRLTRAAALDRDPATGKSATPQAKWARVKALADHYMTGTDSWDQARTPVETGPNLGLLFRAMIGLGYAKDVDRANGLIGKLGVKQNLDRDATIALLWADKAITVKVAELKAIDRVAASSSTLTAASLIGELMADDDEDEGEPGDDGEEIEGLDDDEQA